LLLVLAAAVAMAAKAAEEPDESESDHGSIKKFTKKFSGPMLSRQDQTALERGYSFKLEEQEYYVFVPDNYTGHKPFGLMAMVSAANEPKLKKGQVERSAQKEPPAGQIGRVPFVGKARAERMAQKELLYIAARGVGNTRHTNERAAVTLEGIVQMTKHYRIDPARIYLMGTSGGARVATTIAFFHPNLCHGVVGLSGIEFIHAVPKKLGVRANSSRTKGEPGTYGEIGMETPSLATVKRNVRFAFVTGGKDFRHGDIVDICEGGFQPEGFQARLWDNPNRGHTDCPADTFAEAIDYLDHAK
jgi:hypothetical protein